jgi:hypothetical protein
MVDAVIVDTLPPSQGLIEYSKQVNEFVKSNSFEEKL